VAKYVVKRKLTKNGLFLCGMDLKKKKVPRRRRRLHWQSKFSATQVASSADNMRVNRTCCKASSAARRALLVGAVADYCSLKARTWEFNISAGQ